MPERIIGYADADGFRLNPRTELASCAENDTLFHVITTAGVCDCLCVIVCVCDCLCVCVIVCVCDYLSL